MALDTYTNAYVYINTVPLAQQTMVHVKQKSGNTPVFTTPGGLLGVTQGSATVEISVDEAVPSADFSLNPKQFLATAVPVDIRIVAASHELNVKGFMMEADFQHSVNDNAKMSFQFLCRFGDYES